MSEREKGLLRLLVDSLENERPLVAVVRLASGETALVTTLPHVAETLSMLLTGMNTVIDHVPAFAREAMRKQLAVLMRRLGNAESVDEMLARATKPEVGDAPKT
jgi:hypothetical protein